MVNQKDVEQQLSKVGYKPHGWGRGEVRELGRVMLPGEEIAAAVNGYYDGGFALLVASKERVLLIDKKPLNNLKFEDLRFDMISEFDYSHSLFGATACISSGYKTLTFTSWRQRELRELLNFVQCQMTEVKHVQHSQQEAQQQHLERMNQQLQRYFLEAERRNLELQRQAAQPDYRPQTLTSPDSFDRAAAASISAVPAAAAADESLDRIQDNPSEVSQLSQSQAAADNYAGPASAEVAATNRAESGGSVLDFRQVGFNAIRRVLPMVAAYGGRAFARYKRTPAQRSRLSTAKQL